MIYIDTSSLLKLFVREKESPDVINAVGRSNQVIVSTLTTLEARIQLRAAVLGGKIRPGRLARIEAQFDFELSLVPFTLSKLSGNVFGTALAHHLSTSVHCRSLDWLHLAAMAELGVKRLMTHDGKQAEAARELGYEVEMPGVRI